MVQARPLSTYSGKSAGGWPGWNLEQLKAGLAWHYKQYEKTQPPAERRRYAEAEDLARLNGVGLWVIKRLFHPGIFGANEGRNTEGLPQAEIDALLAGIEVGEVWGVGRRIVAHLQAAGIRTVKDLRDALLT